MSKCALMLFKMAVSPLDKQTTGVGDSEYP